jgi:glycosyltransferase involved in cell wall biosynthesis
VGRLNLLVISELFWPEGSGGTLATYLITKLLTICDFKVTVITGTSNPTRINGVNFIVDEAFRIPNKPARWLYFFVPSIRERYKDLMRKFDIIYIPYGYPLIPLAKELDKKVIVHLHDYQPIAYNSTILYTHNYKGSLISEAKAELTYEILEHESVKRAMAGSLFVSLTALCKEWISKADIVICVSRRQAEIISKAVPELANKIRIMYNPLPEIPSVEEKFEYPTFIYPGGGSYIKGIYIFMQGALKILERWSSVKFMLTGGLKGFRQKYEELVKKLNNIFTGRLRLLRRLPYKDVLRLYSRSHAVLVPSLYEEPLPYVIMEAMAMGTVPIASNVGGIPEMVEGTPAEKMLFEAGDVDDFVDKIESVLAMSDKQIVDIGFALREAVLKKFNHEVVKRKLIKVFSL